MKVRNVKNLKKHFLFIAFLLILFLLSKLLSLQEFQNNESNTLILQQIQNLSFELKNLFSLYPFLVTILFCFSFFIFTLLYVPFVGSLYALLAGSIFGFYKGAIFFSFLVSISYTASFLISKYLLFNFIQKRLGKKSKNIIHAFEQDGTTYLLSLRFSGVIPGVVINSVMSITRVLLPQFYWTTQLGTLPHVITCAFVGSKIVDIQEINSILFERFFPLVILLAISPVLLKIISEFILFKPNRN